MQDLKEKAIRGGLARLLAQGTNLAIRMGSLMVLARLLGPKDFGLVGMVTAFTEALTMFRDFGLSSAAVQHPTVSQEQHSALFWLNLLLGTVLMLTAAAMAPVIVAFYHQPKLLPVVLVLAVGYLFHGLGAQHVALLQRQMRFTALAVIGVFSSILGSVVAIGSAAAGYGYWALVALSLTSLLTANAGFWLATGWVPEIISRHVGVRSMVRFGGIVTLNSLVAYLAYNANKILIGRFWGATAIGIYGRAYQLINIPTDNLNSTAGEVVFSVLARLQDDPPRLKRYFLRGFSLILGLTLPTTIACALFADDLVLVLLGPKWKDAAVIVRLLAPTIAVLAVINPLGWLIYSMGLVARSLKIALVFAPIMIAGCVIGLPHGPEGVASAYSAVMTMWVIPHILWCVRGTTVSLWDILLAASRPMGCGIFAGALAGAVQAICGNLLSPLLRLALESGVLFVVFFGLLLFVAGQKSWYLDILREFKGRSPSAATISSRPVELAR
jgi:O-antigen/teichoic acid export membrane protein